MRPRNPVVLALFFFFLVQAACADDFWQTKPYAEWSKQETQRILENSPWAKRRVLSSDSAELGGGGRSGALNSDNRIDVTYTMQLRTAATVRRAVARQTQLANNYETLAADRKTQLDAKIAEYLSASFPEQVVVQVAFGSNQREYMRLLQDYWEHQSAERLRNVVLLSAGGEQLRLSGFVAGPGLVQFVFPRPKRLPPDGSVIVEFMHPALDATAGLTSNAPAGRRSRGPDTGSSTLADQRVLFEFKVKQLTVNGTPEL